MADEPEILTAQEAADFLRVPLLTVQRQAKAGRLPGRRVGKQWRFARSVLLEWMAAGPDSRDLELYSRREEAATEGEAFQDEAREGRTSPGDEGQALPDE
jgi:excisionase family DNA binding protein